MAENRKSYDFKFKQKVIKYAEENNNREAGRKFSINESMVRRWRKRSSDISEQSSSSQNKQKRLSGAGRKPVLGSLEEELLEKIIDEREKHHHVPCKLITVWALELAKDHNLNDFQASRGWLFRFMQRNSLSIRRRTTTGQTMPKNGLAKIANFVKFCEKQRNTFGFSLGSIANMDETPIWADMPSETTVDQSGKKTVPIKSTGHEKRRITVCLAVRADGSKIKRFVVIPGKKVGSEVSSIQGAIVKCSPNGWMNDELTEDWVSQVWGSLAFSKRFLVWDSFKCHISDNIKQSLKKKNTVMGVIPGGCTKFLQPLDVSINKPFKVIFRELYDEWYRKGEFEYTKGGMVKPPNYVLQVQWVVDAWRKIDPEIIKKSFETCGITTSDVNKIHCLKEGQTTEEARVLLGASDGNLEFIAIPTLDDDVNLDAESLNNENDLTDILIEEGEIEILV